MGVLFNKIAVIGVGLIGGSLGMAIKNAELANQVIGIDINQDNLKQAEKLQAIDVSTTSNYDVLSDVDLVILAASISSNISILKNIKPYLKEGVIITDVGSTKNNFVDVCEEVLSSQGYFIGGHPMAGSEVAGVKGADPYLFENALYILTPTEKTNQEALEKLQNLVIRIGAKVFIISPQEHDLIVASVSHLPHLIAATLVNTVAKIQQDHPDTLLMAAGGFRDTTRIASGSPDLWRDICFNNSHQLLQLVEVFKTTLEDFEVCLRDYKSDTFKVGLEKAKKIRDEIPAKLKGYWPYLEEIIVTIPDKPGMIAQVASILGKRGINIDDIEILRVREGEGGSLRIGFASMGSANRAVEILREYGIIAREK